MSLNRRKHGAEHSGSLTQNHRVPAGDSAAKDKLDDPEVWDNEMNVSNGFSYFDTAQE